MTIRICIADQQPRLRYGLRILLEQQPGLSVNGEAANVQELLEIIQIGCPDLILLDWELPGASAQDLLFKLRTFCPQAIIISMSACHEAHQTAIQAGADGFARKIEHPEKLIGLINKISRDRYKVGSG